MDLSDLKSSITDLTVPSQADFVKKYTEDLLLAGSVSDTKEFLDFLTGLLNAQSGKLEAANPALYDQYEKYWVNLAFRAFSALDNMDQQNLIEQRLLFAIQKGQDLDDFYRQMFDAFGRSPETQKVVRSFAKFFAQNTESLGTAPIEVEGRKLLPQIKYWIQDYSRFPSEVARRGSVERLNYINKSANTRSLTQVQRQQLLQVLKFYDDLIAGEIPFRHVTAVRLTSPAQSAPRPVAPRPPASPPPFRAPPIDIEQKLDELKQRVSN